MPAKFAFLVHPRYSAKEDMGKVSSIFYWFPEKLLETIIPFFPPIIAGKSKFADDPEIKGYIVWIPLLGKQMLNFPRDTVIKKIVKAIQLMKEKGVKIVGLGEFTASITHGGKDLIGKVPGVRLTSGNSLTTGVVFRAVEKLIETKHIDTSKEKIAIIGAAGSIGRGVCALLAEKNNSLILLEKENKIPLSREIFGRLNNIEITTDTNAVKKAKIIVAATSATEQIINADNLAENAIVYDITQPRNTSPSLLEERPDLTIIDGGLIDTPTIDFGVDIGLKKNQAYACLAETVLLALEDIDQDFVGYTTPESARRMLSLMDRHPQIFKINIHQSFGRPLDENLKPFNPFRP